MKEKVRRKEINEKKSREKKKEENKGKTDVSGMIESRIERKIK